MGFYIFISRAIAKGKNGYVLFLRRLVALFIFGLIHQMFQPGEALALYAICGLIVLPFYKAKRSEPSTRTYFDNCLQCNGS